MIPAYITLQHFTTAWIINIWSVGIGYFRREITNDLITGIFKAHCSIVFGPFFSNDGIFETSCFKRFVPIIDTGNYILTPLFGSSRIYIINNRILWFYQFTSFVTFLVFSPWLQ